MGNTGKFPKVTCIFHSSWNKSRQTWWLNTKQAHHLAVLEARNLNQVSLGWCQGVGSPALLLGALEGLLHVPAHIHHLHSWAHGPSFLVKTNSVSSSNLCDLDFYVNISHLWVWLSWLHFTVTLAILQIIQGNFFISKSVIKSHLQSLFFYVK